MKSELPWQIWVSQLFVFIELNWFDFGKAFRRQLMDLRGGQLSSSMLPNPKLVACFFWIALLWSCFEREWEKNSPILWLLLKTFSASTQVWNFLIPRNYVEFYLFCLQPHLRPTSPSGLVKPVEFLFVFLCLNFRDLRRQSASSSMSKESVHSELLLLFLSDNFTGQHVKHL